LLTRNPYFPGAQWFLKGNDKIAKGKRCIFAPKAITKSTEKCIILKSENNIITTKPMNDWKSLFYQFIIKTGSTSVSGKGLGLLIQEI
jgi:hypothetical protein